MKIKHWVGCISRKDCNRRLYVWTRKWSMKPNIVWEASLAFAPFVSFSDTITVPVPTAPPISVHSQTSNKRYTSRVDKPARLTIGPICTYLTICQIRYEKQIERRWHCLTADLGLLASHSWQSRLSVTRIKYPWTLSFPKLVLTPLTFERNVIIQNQGKHYGSYSPPFPLSPSVLFTWQHQDTWN